MAIRCGFFNSIDRDRTYSAEDMNEPYKGLVSNGVMPLNEDASAEESASLKVRQHQGMKVKVLPGRGIFSDKWFWSDSDYVLDVPSNNTIANHRASVIVRVDNRADHREASIEIIQATNKTQIPTINTIAGVKEYRLANIIIRPSAAVISDADITDTRLTDDCGFVHGLIKQLSTEQIFLQWQTMFDEWFEDIQFNLKTQATLTTSLTSNFTTSATSTIIPIDIPQYNRNLDILQVSVNGLDLAEGVDYTIDSDSQITLTKSIYAGNVVSFTAIKSIDGSQAEEIVPQFQEVQQIVNGIAPKVNALGEDTGWIDFTLESGTAIAGLTPAVRKVGNVVYLRGALSGITTTAATSQVTICTLPEALAPIMEHYFTQLVGGTGSGVGYTAVRFKVNRNRASGGNATIVINGSSGTINANQTIPISASFIV